MLMLIPPTLGLQVQHNNDKPLQLPSRGVIHRFGYISAGAPPTPTGRRETTDAP